MTSRVLVVWLGILLVAGAGCGFVAWRQYHTTTLANPGTATEAADLETPPILFPANFNKPAPTFKLTDSEGQEFDSARYRGHVWVGSFFFTTCTGPCYKMNLKLAELNKDWPAEVRLASITCNPEIDTAEQLARYRGQFEKDPARWAFLRGEMPEVTRVAAESFGLLVTKAEHSERVVLYDKAGSIRGQFNLRYPTHVSELRKQVSLLLKEPAPQPAAAPAIDVHATAPGADAEPAAAATSTKPDSELTLAASTPAATSK